MATEGSHVLHKPLSSSPNSYLIYIISLHSAIQYGLKILSQNFTECNPDLLRVKQLFLTHLNSIAVSSKPTFMFKLTKCNTNLMTSLV